MDKLKTNIIIFLIAIVLSTALFYATEHPELFSASILSLQDAETIEAQNRDIWYKNEWNILDTFLSYDLQNISSITFSVIYDYQNTNLDIQKIDAQTEYEIIADSEWGVVIKFTNFSWIKYDYQQSLFELPFKWEMPTVLISEWTADLLNWDHKLLSIWLLNTDETEYHQDFN